LVQLSVKRLGLPLGWQMVWLSVLQMVTEWATLLV